MTFLHSCWVLIQSVLMHLTSHTGVIALIRSLFWILRIQFLSCRIKKYPLSCYSDHKLDV